MLNLGVKRVFALGGSRPIGYNSPMAGTLEGTDPVVPSRLEQLCAAKGLRMTDQRRLIARVLSEATDHPDVEQLHRRVTKIDAGVSVATVYRTLRLFEEANILERHDFGGGRARYEETPTEHHDHLIDIQSGRVIEFRDEAIEALQRKVAERLGYRLAGHRLELYAVPLAAKTEKPANGPDKDGHATLGRAVASGGRGHGG